MSRLRELLAFCCASVIHLLIIVIPFIDENPLVPELTGTTSIQINLASTSAKVIEEIPSDSQKESPEQSPPEPEKIPQKETPEYEQLTETIQQKPEVVIPEVTQTQPKKQIEKTKEKQPSPQHQKAKTSAAAPVSSQATPLYYKNPKPAYPSLARKRNWQGSVVLSIMVLEDGTVGEVRIQKSSGHEMLDSSALRTVKTWRFLPGMKNGQPVSMMVQVPIHFKLD